MHYMRVESRKDTLWLQTLKNWSRWTRLNSTPEGSMQRKCWRRWKVTNFESPAADGTVKIPGGDQRLRTCTLIRDGLERGEEQEVLRGESDGLSSPNPLQEDSTRGRAMRKPKLTSGLSREISFFAIFWTQSQTVHAERRIIPHSDEVHRRYQINTYITGCNVGETDWWLWERGWRERIIRRMDRPHKIHFIERKSTWRIYMVRERLQSGAHVIPMPQAMKISDAKAAVEKMRKTQDNTCMTADESQKQKEVIEEARNEGRTVHFASLMDLCHLKNSELEPKFQKYKGRVVLRGDIVKEWLWILCRIYRTRTISITNDGSKVMDIISRLPGCGGQAADAVSANTQVKMEDVPKLLKIPKSECPDIWIRLPRHKWPIMVQYGRPSCSSWKKSVRSSFGRTLVGMAIRESSMRTRLAKSSKLVNREQRLFLSVYVDDIKLAGKKQNIDPMWKLLNKEVDLGEPASFLDHVIFGMHSKRV